MAKKLTKLLTLGVAIIMILGLVVGLAGCGKKDKPETEGFYELTEAYKNTWLSRDDLKNIAYHLRGKVTDKNDKTIEHNPAPKNPESLSTDVENKIKEAYFNVFIEPKVSTHSHPEEFDAKRIVAQYCGKYNGFIAVKMRQGYWDYPTVEGRDEAQIVGNIFFTRYHGPEDLLYLWFDKSL